jgi:hypothetical protein
MRERKREGEVEEDLHRMGMTQWRRQRIEQFGNEEPQLKN